MKIKKTFLIAAAVFMLTSCGNKSQQRTPEETTTTQATSEAPVYELEKLLADADKRLNQTVVVKGTVTHTCKHSGKRCFIVGEDGKTSFRVEAKGDIGGFNKELVGSELAIKGILKERRLTKEYIDQYEKEVNEQKNQEDGSAETCQAELTNIASMRDWMKDNNKDYYAIYYMDGESYEIVE
ncbi:MAG: OB-fold nucleic acid binding domain-containing protein [Tannerellaceae bacterium]|jgi:hypothetical protein|nr:OB-fold nucleic acid binding domain-containing protein [Tannerellaceae bacterium]